MYRGKEIPVSEHGVKKVYQYITKELTRTTKTSKQLQTCKLLHLWIGSEVSIPKPKRTISRHRPHCYGLRTPSDVVNNVTLTGLRSPVDDDDSRQVSWLCSDHHHILPLTQMVLSDFGPRDPRVDHDVDQISESDVNDRTLCFDTPSGTTTHNNTTRFTTPSSILEYEWRKKKGFTCYREGIRYDGLNPSSLCPLFDRKDDRSYV